MKEKKLGQSVRSVRCEDGWEAHSIADVYSMKEKNARQVTNVTNRVVFGKSVLTQGCERGVTNERKKTPSVNRDRIVT